MPANDTDHHWMDMALAEARTAADRGEIPVGAVLVKDGVCVARGHNTREADRDPSGHAEMHVLRQAAPDNDSWRREGATLYVTLEPCPMCAGAAMLARVDRIVYGAPDAVMGAAGSVYDLPRDTRLPWTLSVTGGVRQEECRAVLTGFFRTRRNPPDGEMPDLTGGESPRTLF